MERDTKLHDFNTAMRLRDIMRSLADRRIALLRPEDRYATIITVDRVNFKAGVIYAEGGNIVNVPFSKNVQPSDYGQIVRISGPRGSRYISGILTAPTWHDLTLLNSWVNFASGYPNAGYMICTDGCVRLRGVIKSGTTNANAAVIPIPPMTHCIYSAIQGDGSGKRVDVLTDGNLLINSAVTSTAYLSLDGISYQTV